MQRDTGLAFRDIYETPELMLAGAKKICRPSILASSSPDEALDLRFLTFDSGTPGSLLSLTEKGQHVGETNYVAVSYTWQRFDPITNSEAVSTYMIAAGGSVRKARTQDAVLYRAVRFAKANDCRFIWTDQDCIDQTDDEDLERYSHVVHSIFNRSRHPIGLLSFHLFRQSHIDLLRYLIDGTCLKKLDEVLHERPESGILQLSENLVRCLRLFAAVAEDKWFTRAWVLMERLSAPHMRLLLPCESPLSSHDSVPSEPSDIDISCTALHHVARRFREISQSLAFSSESLKQGPSLQALGGIISRFEQLLSTKYAVHSGTSPWLQTLTLENITRIFQSVEECDNTVLSDKLLIMSYLCGFPKRLNTRKLNHYEYSYSTSVLVLLLLNGWLPKRRRGSDASFIWNHSLSEVLGHWQCEEHQTNGLSEFIHTTLDETTLNDSFIDRLHEIEVLHTN